MLDPSWLQLASSRTPVGSRSGSPATSEPNPALPNSFPRVSGAAKPKASQARGQRPGGWGVASLNIYKHIPVGTERIHDYPLHITPKAFSFEMRLGGDQDLYTVQSSPVILCVESPGQKENVELEGRKEGLFCDVPRGGVSTSKRGG